MTHSFKSAPRGSRLRGPAAAFLILALAGCANDDSFNPDTSTLPDASLPAEPAGDPAFAVGFAGGIPFGTYALPTNQFGDRFNGALRNIWPSGLVRELAAIKARGGKVVLMMAGNERYYKDAEGHFSLGKWRERINRFRGVNFSSYINDGTIIAHYVIDEPNDPHNWRGRPIPGDMVEQMAAYSKQLWPNLPTVARVDPAYLKGDGPYRHLDAVWAQYVNRKGEAGDYIRRNVADAQGLGLALITGLNLLDGGPNKSRMSASQVKSWGSTLLASSYPCAFISWKYNADYLESGAMRDAMNELRRRAENRGIKSCRS